MEESQAPSERQSLGSLLLKKRKGSTLGLDSQKWIRAFFASNASVTIIVLVLIMLFLLKEGADFLGTYKHELEIYRRAGLEFCDIVDRPLAEHQQLTSSLRRALGASLDTISQKARNRRDTYFSLKRQVEEASALQREALTAALEQTPPAAAEILTPLRQQLFAANAKAVTVITLSELFSAGEADSVRAELRQLTPEVSDLPAFLRQLSADFAAKDETAKETFGALVETAENFEEAPEPLQEVLDEVKEHVLETKAAAVEFHTMESGRLKLVEAAEKAKDAAEKADLLKEAEASQAEAVDFKERIKTVVSRADELSGKVHDYATAVQKAATNLPKTGGTAEATAMLNEVHRLLPQHIQEMETAADQLKSWNPDKSVSFFSVIRAFFFGSNWLTNSSWQDFFGFVPLLTGSLVIAFIAILIATPLSITAAIYTNQFASDREKEIIKPIIEFIQAIPSVVLGFIGISVLGNLIKDVSEVPWLQWMPGFPIQERLNMFNAGCLLALMAIPTMFSLSEDALNNVPQAYVDASDALGATKLQTVFRVIVPAALSGMAAAILLGLGRVIGETMVVLLVAGNRIAIPDFSSGPSVVFQPAHTLTGIIAQELGEVSRGSAHWQALFMVGIVLFCISLIVNWFARTFVRRFEQFKA
ncbi:MAG: phosphate ABC transporter permease subunit PstC [Verrucomicrobia bacterium]|nr:phosphate ABC transporter permease subunit PstC [Verrucomicrobiota bacterium]